MGLRDARAPEANGDAVVPREDADGLVRRGQIECAAVPRTPAPTAERQVDRLIQLPDVAPLVQGAVEACALGTGRAHRGYVAIFPVLIRGTKMVDDVRAWVGDIACHTGNGDRRRLIRTGGIQPIIVRVAASGRRVMIGRLVPFVFAGNEMGRARAADLVQSSANGVSPTLSATTIGWLTVFQPIRKSHGVKERNEVDRLVAHVRLGHIGRPNGGYAGQRDPTAFLRAYVGVVNAVRIRPSSVNRVEEFGVLRVRDFVFADAEHVVDRTKSGCIRRVPNVPNGRPIEVDVAVNIVQKNKIAAHNCQRQGGGFLKGKSINDLHLAYLQ